MAKMRPGSFCPRCGKKKIHRIHRKNWMRYLPKSKHYHCANCRARYLTICGWAIRLPPQPSSKGK